VAVAGEECDEVPEKDAADERQPSSGFDDHEHDRDEREEHGAPESGALEEPGDAAPDHTYCTGCAGPHSPPFHGTVRLCHTYWGSGRRKYVFPTPFRLSPNFAGYRASESDRTVSDMSHRLSLSGSSIQRA